MATQVLAGNIPAVATATFAAGLPATTWSLAGDVPATAGAAFVASAPNSIWALAGDVPATAGATFAAARRWELVGLPVEAVAVATFSASAAHALAGNIPATGAANFVPLVEGQGLLVRDCVIAVMRLLQAGCSCELPTDVCLQDAILNQVNAALQTIYSRADRLDYFSRATVTMAFTNGLESLAFTQAIQSVIGPVRLEASKVTLREVTDRAQFDQFANTFYGDDVPDAPRAYFIRAHNYSGGDNLALTLYVTPTPTESLNILADVIYEAPRYVWSDVLLGTALQLPNKYAEVLLLPLCREWATSSEFFWYKDQLPQILSQADKARQILGLIEPVKPKSTREAGAHQPWKGVAA